MVSEDPKLSNATDEALVEGIRSGEKASFEVLMKRYLKKIYDLAFRFTGDPKDSEEILQETFLQVSQKLDTFRGDAQFSTWLYRIATNQALMRLRSNQRHPLESLDEFLPKYNEEGRLARLDLDYGRAARADELLESRELSVKIQDAIAKLPDIYQAPLILRDLQELTSEETGKILGIEPALVRTRLHRARLLLRGYLGHLVGGES